jgi:hypothetical protein
MCSVPAVIKQVDPSRLIQHIWKLTATGGLFEVQFTAFYKLIDISFGMPFIVQVTREFWC